jgi:MFS family permease
MTGFGLSLPALMRHNSFGNFWCARVATTMAYQMQSVAIGWQIYDITGSALDLGLVGLVQFLPTVALSVLVGPAVDHFDRKIIARTCQCVGALAATMLALGTAAGWLARDTILLLVFMSGTARAFEMPSMLALVPGIVAPALLPRAIAASASASQTAIICGPALGGLIYGFGPTVVYALCAVIYVIASILVAVLRTAPRSTERAPVTPATMFAGFSYIRSRPWLSASPLSCFRCSLALSLGALVVYGAMDAVSVVIRQSLVQTRTPADMLGRVIAVNAMFTGTTGSLGQFRAGLFAALLGAAPSALIGGIGAIAVTGLWIWWFPDLKRIGSLEHEPVLLGRGDPAALGTGQGRVAPRLCRRTSISRKPLASGSARAPRLAAPGTRLYSSLGVWSSIAPGSAREGANAMESMKRAGSGEARSPRAGWVASRAMSRPLVK